MVDDRLGVVPVPRLLSRDVGTWLAVAATGVGLLGLSAWAVLTQPALNATIGVGLTVLMVVLIGGLALRRHELDTTAGALVRAWGPGFRRAVPWRTARVELVPNRGGQLQLAVRRPEGRATYLPLMAADLGGPRSQTPGFLRLLADEVEKGGHVAVAKRLRAQADHLESGGQVLGSPLHRLMARSG